MMDIHFVRNGLSYLPELDAYGEHLRKLGHGARMHDTHDTVPADAQVVWWMCGRVDTAAAQRLGAAFHVHEYASASVPPAAWLKDRIKRWTQPLPGHRVFQSEWVRRRLGFDAKIPFSLRDMGVPRAFLEARATRDAEFDFVYLGEMSRLAEFEPALRTLDTAGFSLLLVGSMPPRLQELVNSLHHAQVVGRVPQAQVPAQLLRARAGLNLMPRRLPLTEQTSTKVLEYLAVGLPVASNDYAWIRRLASTYPGRVLRLHDFSASSWHQVVRELPAREDHRDHLEHLTWEAKLAGLPVWDAIRQFQASAGRAA